MRSAIISLGLLLPLLTSAFDDASKAALEKRSTATSTTSTFNPDLTTFISTAAATSAIATLVGTNNYGFPSKKDPTYLAHYIPPDSEDISDPNDGTDAWVTIPDLSNTVQLVANTDGNLYLGSRGNSSTTNPPGTTFYSEDYIILNDEQDRFFVYYPAEMAAYGVSRLRLTDLETNTPIGSQMITLVPFATNGSNLYAAVDTSGNAFYLAWCNLYGQGPSKVFMVRDYNASMTTLASSEVQWTVTGGVVQQCAPLVLSAAHHAA